MLQAAIFDLDGTLLDTIAEITAIINHGLSEYNLPLHSKESCAEIVGMGLEALVRMALPQDFDDKALFGKIYELVRKKYNENPTGKTVPYPGVSTLLDRLSEKKIPMAILSNKPHSIAIANVAQLLGKWNFVAVQGALEKKAPKPGSKAALCIAAKMNLEPASIAFIGDSEIDIQTAKNTGMYSVAVSWGFRSRETLAAAMPDIIVNSPVDIINIFL